MVLVINSHEEDQTYGAFVAAEEAKGKERQRRGRRECTILDKSHIKRYNWNKHQPLLYSSKEEKRKQKFL